MRISLPYGRQPLAVDVPDDAAVIAVPVAPPTGDVLSLCRQAMDGPVAAPSLEVVARTARRATIIVSDATRADPQGAMAAAVIERLPQTCAVTLAIATGTHGTCNLDRLDIPAAVLDRVTAIINHDGHAADDARLVGHTTRGTPIRVNAQALDTDLLILTGRILPHYFAGFGAGVKALYPGLGEARSVRANHALKRDPAARAGIVDGNPCREDMEEALAMISPPAYLLNVVAAPGGGLAGAVAGDVRQAFRTGADLGRRAWRVRAARAGAIVVSDHLPVTESLYQASKLVAAVAPLCEDHATIVVAAECERGIGPVDVVNEGIYEIGLRPRLPADHRIVLVSSRAASEVNATYCEPARSVEEALAAASGPIAVVPEAGSLIVEASE